LKVIQRTLCPSFIDSIISAEIPDKSVDPLGYSIVDEFMVHGPCGELNKKCACMKNNRCSKFFPKGYEASTVVGEDGFGHYRRGPEAANFVERYGIRLDNGWVVPYNLALLKRFRAHINVEWCNKTHLIKYLFKYITKGPDRARAVIETFGAGAPCSDSHGEAISSFGDQPVNAQKHMMLTRSGNTLIVAIYPPTRLSGVCSNLISTLGRQQWKG